MTFDSILISGLPGSGKSVLARQLSSIYFWPVFSAREHWENMRNDFGTPLSFEEFWKNTSTEENLKFDRAAREALTQGRIICDMRFPKAAEGLGNVFKIFCAADVHTRASRAISLGKYPDKTKEQIEQILQCREADELIISRHMYGEAYDFRDPENFDLILNTGKASVEEEVNEILELLGNPRIDKE